MNNFFTEPIIISAEYSSEFLKSLMYPDRAYMHSRNTIFNEIDHSIDIQKNGMDMEVEIQNLDLSFIDEMNHQYKIDVWDTISVRLEKTCWHQIDLQDTDSMMYINLKDNNEMQDVKDNNQMQMAA